MSDLAPFFKIGVTFATFHSLGKMPWSIELLNMLVSKGPTISPASFNGLQGILSNSVAFFSFMSLNSLQTVITLGKTLYQWAEDRTPVQHLLGVFHMLGPIVVKNLLIASAILGADFIVLL